jgi:hypothetical protein
MELNCVKQPLMSLRAALAHVFRQQTYGVHRYIPNEKNDQTEFAFDGSGQTACFAVQRAKIKTMKRPVRVSIHSREQERRQAGKTSAAWTPGNSAGS